MEHHDAVGDAVDPPVGPRQRAAVRVHLERAPYVAGRRDGPVDHLGVDDGVLADELADLPVLLPLPAGFLLFFRCHVFSFRLNEEKPGGGSRLLFSGCEAGDYLLIFQNFQPLTSFPVMDFPAPLGELKVAFPTL